LFVLRGVFGKRRSLEAVGERGKIGTIIDGIRRFFGEDSKADRPKERETVC
jgi:hypothetical protein